MADVLEALGSGDAASDADDFLEALGSDAASEATSEANVLDGLPSSSEHEAPTGKRRTAIPGQREQPWRTRVVDARRPTFSFQKSSALDSVSFVGLNHRQKKTLKQKLRRHQKRVSQEKAEHETQRASIAQAWDKHALRRGERLRHGLKATRCSRAGMAWQQPQ